MCKIGKNRHDIRASVRRNKAQPDQGQKRGRVVSIAETKRQRPDRS